MLKQMKESRDKGQTINIVEHIILSNFWEIYVIESKKESENVALDPGELFTLTVGWETEMGYQYESEMADHIISRTQDLEGILPAPGWEWVN